MKKAILISYDREDAVAEAVDLCGAAGYNPELIIRQKYLNRPKYGISGGAVESLEEDAKRIDPDVIVFDEMLRPSQNYNLASRLHRNVLDREALILEIFELRATGHESRLQVKLAQMRYEMSRAREKVRLAKMGEQPGFMGIGKFEVDVYYNDIKHRMTSVRSKLAKAGRQRELHRQARRRVGFGTISLAGYTSAGKTTLFNRLTGEAREEDVRPFTTLSTMTRRVGDGPGALLISDTVGFISKLPAYMIEAFKSTLEEMLHTDVILLVVDISDTPEDLEKKFRSCTRTLSELGVPPDKVITALNKSDLVDAAEIRKKTELLGLDGGGNWAVVSATTGQNLEGLMGLARGFISSRGGPGAA
ncbi:GTPase [Cenarchaeum symbiosum A]|uniref:GTPase HflX n=1 Tax=Cenarchaeum symbiosum (strain A) TaxID=414004 RepID=A0RYD2_CENSY|nr:GTPase [Cenarchaeum symbiosum A]